MIFEDFILIKKFEQMFGGSVFQEEPGEQWIYEKDEHCYSLPNTFLSVIRKSIEDEKDHLITIGTEVDYDPEAIY